MIANLRLAGVEPADAAEVVSCHALVIGSGVAGLTVALRLSQLGDVVVVTKQRLAETTTEYAQGGVACVWSTEDSFDLHISDTLVAGDGLCKESAVQVLVTEGPASVRRLIQLGADFDEKEGELDLTREAAHSRRRILHARGDATGAEIQTTLSRAALANPNLALREYEFLVELLTHEGQVVGALTVDQRTHKLILYKTSTIVLCTGGLGQVFSYTTNPSVATGDGLAAAYRAGAEVADLEFVQFHPTALGVPTKDHRIALVSESVRGEGALLRNCNGELFMASYHPEAELAPRDVVARAIVLEKQRTGCDTIYLDMREMEGDVATRFPTITQSCLDVGLDPAKVLIPVMPVAHYHMGGIIVDRYGRASLQGLYASGEVACTGVHGANRLASNSMLEAMVFSDRIASYLAKEGLPAPEASLPHLTQANQATAQGIGEETLAELQQLNWEKLGILRDGEGLKSALERLDTLAWKLCPDLSNIKGLEVLNVALVGRLMAESALARTESRGAHYRLDYPQRDDEHWHIRLLHALGQPARRVPVDYPLSESEAQ